MSYTNVKSFIRVVLLITVFGIALGSIPAARAGDKKPAPDLPPACSDLQVPQGSKAIFHVYARGVQIYRWDGAAWVFVAPVATLFADADYHGQVGIHYAGPTWESNSGSKVVASRVDGCSPDQTAIAWLLLKTVSTNGPGIFSSVSHIHRVNTTGGLVPTAPGSSIGEAVEIPYTAEYYFYRDGEED